MDVLDYSIHNRIQSFFMNVSGQIRSGRLHQSNCSGGCSLRRSGMWTGAGRYADQRGKRANAGTPKLLPEYEASVGARIQMLRGHWGHEMSDPARVAQVILQLASKDQLLHICCSAAMPCSMPGSPRKNGIPTPRHGVTSAFQQTLRT
jgi:hypothetical protein